MSRSAAALAVALVLVATSAAAEEPLRLADFGLKGQAVLKNFSQFSDAPNDDQTFVDLFLLQLEWSRRFASWGAAKAVVEFVTTTSVTRAGCTSRFPRRIRSVPI